MSFRIDFGGLMTFVAEDWLAPTEVTVMAINAHEVGDHDLCRHEPWLTFWEVFDRDHQPGDKLNASNHLFKLISEDARGNSIETDLRTFQTPGVGLLCGMPLAGKRVEVIDAGTAAFDLDLGSVIDLEMLVPGSSLSVKRDVASPAKDGAVSATITLPGGRLSCPVVAQGIELVDVKNEKRAPERAIAEVIRWEVEQDPEIAPSLRITDGIRGSIETLQFTYRARLAISNLCGQDAVSGSPKNDLFGVYEVCSPLLPKAERLVPAPNKVVGSHIRLNQSFCPPTKGRWLGA